MGERKKHAIMVKLDRRLKLEFDGTKVISDVGLLVHHKLDNAPGLTAATALDFCVGRRGKNPGTGGAWYQAL